MVLENLNSKLDVKRAIMICLPGVPPPLIDYAMSTPFFASVTGRGNSVPQPPAEEDPDNKSTFTLKRMDSGEWGERNLSHPIQQRYNPEFGEPSQLKFELEG